MALDFEGRLVPFLNLRFSVFEWKRIHQLSALSPARRVQWMRAVQISVTMHQARLVVLTLLTSSKANDLAVERVADTVRLGVLERNGGNSQVSLSGLG